MATGLTHHIGCTETVRHLEENPTEFEANMSRELRMLYPDWATSLAKMSVSGEWADELVSWGLSTASLHRWRCSQAMGFACSSSQSLGGSWHFLSIKKPKLRPPLPIGQHPT